MACANAAGGRRRWTARWCRSRPRRNARVGESSFGHLGRRGVPALDRSAHAGSDALPAGEGIAARGGDQAGACATSPSSSILKCRMMTSSTTVRAARARLAPLFACVNGTTAPEFSAFGHSHIDVAWLWPLRETEAKCTRTFATPLALMEEYPEYRLPAESTVSLLDREATLPGALCARESERWRRALDSRRRHVGGGGHQYHRRREPHPAIPARQALLPRRIRRGQRAAAGCPMSSAIPARCRKSCAAAASKYFSTQKIYWMYNGGDPFPYTTFTWEGIDGSEVLASMHHDYNSQTDPQALITRWNERRQKVGLSSRLVPFGWGDGGGGPTRTHLEFLRRCMTWKACRACGMEGPLAHFKDLERRGYPRDRYVGELYFQAHRGVPTTQAKTKQGNRKSEFALREAELWGAAARALAGFRLSRRRRSISPGSRCCSTSSMISFPAPPSTASMRKRRRAMRASSTPPRRRRRRRSPR